VIPLDATKVPLEGTVLVEASAGTGKTYTITTLFVRLVVEVGLSVREIVVVTFTEAATAELRSRIRGRLREALAAFASADGDVGDDLRAIVGASKNHGLAKERLERAISELDLAGISTIHSFCLRVLQERAFESGARFGLDLMTDSSELVREVTEDFWASRMEPMALDLFRMCAADFTLELNRKRVVKGFALQTARRLVETFMRHPVDLPVLPQPAPPDPELSRIQLAKAYERAREAWLRTGKKVAAILEKAKAEISRDRKNGYTPDRIALWCDELDDLFADSAPAFYTGDALKMMATSTLEGKTRKGATTPRHEFFDRAQTLFDLGSQAKKGLIVGLKRGIVDYVRREMPARKQQRGVQGFEDLLFTLDRALQGPQAPALAAALRGQFQAALIDEFQDTDPVQFRIFHAIFHGSRTLLLVGDPKQSIYAFRGADVFSYITAAKNAGKSAYTLGTNHRSDPSLVRAVNTLFSRARAPVFVMPEIGFHPVSAHAKADRIDLPKGGGALEVLFYPRPPGEASHTKGDLEQDLPDLVAAEIARFLAAGAKILGKRVTAGDLAVLTRTNDQARWMQDALRNLGIPTVVETDASVFESSEATEVEQLLRAVLEPTRTPLVKAALATSIVGLHADEIVALEGDEPGWQGWSDRLRGVQEDWARSGFIQAYRRMLASLGVEKRLLSYVDGERRVTNFVHLGELLHLASVRERLGPTGTVRWLGARRAEEIARGALGTEAGELRLESDERSVKILTVHKSKGLEYPVVYCPFLWALKPMQDDVCTAFHDPADDRRLKIHLDPDDRTKSVAEDEQRAENVRILYVALTRAKHRCSIVWGGIHQAENTPLACALHPESAEVPSAQRADAELRADLAALAKAARGAIVVNDLVKGTAPAYVPEEAATKALAARRYGRKVDGWWRIGSFSAMASGEREASADDARDRDEVDEPTTTAGPTPAESAERVVLDGFPRGTKPGFLLHSILEDLDFASKDRGALEALVREKLASYGYGDGQDELGPTLAGGLEAMLDTPLDPGGFPLRAVARTKRIDELEFLLPVAQETGAVTAKRIAEALAKHANGAVPASYVDGLRGLRFVPLRGFLRGFIDLVFEHEGRFYVVDYKSNHLGGVASDYAPARLVASMAEHDYFLQYHLYVVAADRWLRRRVKGYDYEKRFGGVFYLFARGMSPAHAAGTGVFFDRPRAALVGALSEVLDG